MGVIQYEDFARVELRVGQVRAAERVPKADKLLRLSVDVGEPEARTIVAGIAQAYPEPGALVRQAHRGGGEPRAARRCGASPARACCSRPGSRPA